MNPLSGQNLRRTATLFLLLMLAVPAGAANRTVARCGQGFLELQDGYAVLHLKGNPYQMGYQHGKLMQDSIRQNLNYLLTVKAKEKKIEVLGMEVLTLPELIRGIVARQQKFLPREFQDELDGVADGAGVPREDLQMANAIPELFHCSGFAVMNKATRDGTLYHGRVLDYAVDWGLQDHAVLIVGEPAGGIPFVNVGYGGFIGSVTGMNAAHISVGEMGGRGRGHWDGVPMAILIREVLQRARTLDEALALFRDQPRTCQYFYVVADGNSNRAVGLEASWNRFEVVKPGESHPRLPHAIPDAVVLSAGSRYEELARRVKAGWGQLDANSARQLMASPVAMKSNLHDVLFAPASTRFWVANASHDRRPAADQPYHAFQLTDLLKHQADPTAPGSACPEGKRQ